MPARSSQPDTPELGIGMVGYAFMGAAHSRAWATVAQALLARGATPRNPPLRYAPRLRYPPTHRPLAGHKARTRWAGMSASP